MKGALVVIAMLAAGACSKDSTSLAHTPTRVAFLTEPSNTVADSAMPGSIDIGVVDNTGSVRTNATSVVTIGIANNPGGATLTGTTTVAAVNGIATFTGLKLDKAGTAYTLVATSPGLMPDTSAVFSVNP